MLVICGSRDASKMTLLVIDTFTVANPGKEFENFIKDEYLPSILRLNKKLKSVRYLSCAAGDNVTPYGGRIIITEFESLGEWESSGLELMKNEENNKLTGKFGSMIERSTYRRILAYEGSLPTYQTKSS